MRLDEVEHLVGERVGGVKPGALNGAATGSGGEKGEGSGGVSWPRQDGVDNKIMDNVMLRGWGHPNPPRLGDDFIGDGRPNGLGRLLLLEPTVEHSGQLLHVEGADGRTWDAARDRKRSGSTLNLLHLLCSCADGKN